jgi:hypothetical protein
MTDEDLCNALASQLADEHNAVVAKAAATPAAFHIPRAHPNLRDRLAEVFLALRQRGEPLGMIMSVHGHIVGAAASATDDQWPVVKASLERQFYPQG